ncbi:hypothetical protein F5879DRAFT_927929, partial [Lentinula edodes]
VKFGRCGRWEKGDLGDAGDLGDFGDGRWEIGDVRREKGDTTRRWEMGGRTRTASMSMSMYVYVYVGFILGKVVEVQEGDQDISLGTFNSHLFFDHQHYTTPRHTTLHHATPRHRASQELELCECELDLSRSLISSLFTPESLNQHRMEGVCGLFGNGVGVGVGVGVGIGVGVGVGIGIGTDSFDGGTSAQEDGEGLGYSIISNGFMEWRLLVQELESSNVLELIPRMHRYHERIGTTNVPVQYPELPYIQNLGFNSDSFKVREGFIICHWRVWVGVLYEERLV